jgi:hypothetical protein
MGSTLDGNQHISSQELSPQSVSKQSADAFDFMTSLFTSVDSSFERNASLMVRFGLLLPSLSLSFPYSLARLLRESCLNQTGVDSVVHAIMFSTAHKLMQVRTFL